MYCAMDDTYLNENDVAEMLKISVWTLRSNRAKKKGLPYVKHGRTVRYRLSDIQEYMEEHKIEPEETPRRKP